MKTKASIILALVLLPVMFLSCNQTRIDPRPTDPAASEQTAVNDPTAEPHNEQTPEPAITAAPTDIPEPVSLDFTACASEVLRLIPHIADDYGDMPGGPDNGHVLYYDNSDGGDISNFGPRFFTTDGRTVVIYDLDDTLLIRGVDGTSYRTGPLNIGSERFALLGNGSVYTSDAKASISTGEKEADHLFGDYSLTSDLFGMTWGADEPLLIVLDPESEPGTLHYRYYELNEENVWTEGGVYCSSYSDEGGNLVFVLPDGAECAANNSYAELIGLDESGNLFISLGSVIRKYNSRGELVSQTALPFRFTDANIWEPDFHYVLLPDGTIYMSAAFSDSYVIYKIVI